MSLILLLLILLLLFGSVPTWPYSRDWGYGPSGAFGTILVLIVLLMLAGRF